jgi:hypothetical protein
MPIDPIINGDMEQQGDDLPSYEVESELNKELQLPQETSTEELPPHPLDKESLSPDHLRIHPNEVIAYIQNLRVRIHRLTYQYLQSQDNLRKTNRELSVIKGEHGVLKQAYEDLNDRMNAAISELASVKRDRSTGYVANSGPQNYVLAQEFRSFADQELHRVSNEVYRHLCELDPKLRPQRKLILSKLKSVLSTEIFIKGKVVGSEVASGDELVTALITKRVAESVNKELGHEIFGPAPSRLQELLVDLVLKGISLLKNVSEADPPGEFWIEGPGEPFNMERHEPVLECEGSGKINLTVFPGYSVNGRVYSKAIVRTYQE